MKRFMVVVVCCPRCRSNNIVFLDSFNYLCNDCGFKGKKPRFESSYLIRNSAKMFDLKYKLWKIKNWLKYEPLIFWNRFLAKLFHISTDILDRLGYLLFGKKKWEELKEKEDLK
jgi:hypothetical protein